MIENNLRVLPNEVQNLAIEINLVVHRETPWHQSNLKYMLNSKNLFELITCHLMDTFQDLQIVTIGALCLCANI